MDGGLGGRVHDLSEFMRGNSAAGQGAVEVKQEAISPHAEQTVSCVVRFEEIWGGRGSGEYRCGCSSRISLISIIAAASPSPPPESHVARYTDAFSFAASAMSAFGSLFGPYLSPTFYPGLSAGRPLLADSEFTHRRERAGRSPPVKGDTAGAADSST